MTVLYNCKTDGDQFRISKFDDLGNVESTYLCSETECQCPAGHRPSCRHRIMLPLFIANDKVDSFYFLDFDRKGWVSNEPAPLESWREAAISDFISPNPLLEELTYSERSELGSSNTPSLQPAPVFNPTAGIPKTSFGVKDAPSFDNATWFSTVQPPNEPAALTIKTMITFPDDVSAEELVEAYSNLLGKQVSGVHEDVPIVEVEDIRPTNPEFQFGGFPYECFDADCTTPYDCVLNGCAKGKGSPSRRVTKPSWRRI